MSIAPDAFRAVFRHVPGHPSSKPAPLAPALGKVTIYDAHTGAAIDRWPVDAREMIASGAFLWAPPGEVAPAPDWAKGIKGTHATDRRGDQGEAEYVPRDTPLGMPAS